MHSPFPHEINGYANELKANNPLQTLQPWVVSKKGKVISDGSQFHPPRFILDSPWGQTPLNLPGARGAENAMLALTTFEALGYDVKKYLGAMGKIRWPGRMELAGFTEKKTPIYLSGDHNPGGMLSLLELLPYYPRRNLYVVCAVGKEKNFEKMMEVLFSIPNTKILLTETSFQGRTLDQFGAWSDKALGKFPQVEQALSEATHLAENKDMILVTGSLYLVGAAKSLVR